MTDKEFIEMSRLLESLTKRSYTLRDLFPGKGELTDEIKSHPLFVARWGLHTLEEKEVKELIGIINGCEDWTSDKFKASEIYRMMLEFVSITSRMPVGVGLFDEIQSLCEKRMEIIAGRHLGRIHPKVREMLSGQDYKDKVKDGDIIPPFTWTSSVKQLAIFLDNAIDLTIPKIDQVDGKEDRRDWSIVDSLFYNKDGQPVTAKQLSNAMKH